ncbi:MAG: hypothetical protein A3G41_00825 [Elusimicrobia bacterium RIFCSPLOWO2_12_FULL_59_9]|nr:MAG: hypothetical protein A3G41_00825 [Elusimicrobia bacterium RIFCSPLOWO2_12_FULL_59_9]
MLKNAKIFLLVASLYLVLKPLARPRPYYAASKGINCSACHFNPAGGGIRKATQNSPTRINEALTLGADFRFLWKKAERQRAIYNSPPRGTAIYLAAEPSPGVSFVYHANDGITAQAYGLWKSGDEFPLPSFYVKAGKFFLPYGLQSEDPDDSAFIKNSAPFVSASGVGFGMKSGQSDSGVEIGLSPKKGFFANAAYTNGGANNTAGAKALAARLGIIRDIFMLGGGAFKNTTGIASTDRKELRYGPMAWLKLGPVVVMGEGAFGVNQALSNNARTRFQGTLLEINYAPRPKVLLLKGRFDTMNPDVSAGGDDQQQFSLAAEWFVAPYCSVTPEFRVRRLRPRQPDNQASLSAHFWF